MVDPEVAQTCPECGGSGRLTCPACKGEGHRTCPSCHGAGCDACDASGVVDCPKAVVCQGCGGTGMI